MLDQNGDALFAKDFKPNPHATSPESGILLKEIRQSKSGHFELRGNVYSFSPVESTGWVAVVQQPAAIAYKPVHDLLNRMNILVGWLLVGTAFAA